MNTYMLLAVQEALKSGKDVPVGALIVKDDKIISKAHNEVIKNNDPTAHAEILAIREACSILDSYNLSGCSIYVTLEPCPMCAGAIINAKIDKVVYGAMDMDYGACGSKYNLLQDNRAKSIEVYAGIEEDKCSVILKDFFEQIRNK
ncbi:nucleoside deaminase [Anaerofustis stercorihominis]|uniref:nucleoside deaminase n=1 Tax=Anaerofustis stercorihominis TaxID=214853 RepID=UPI002109BF8F|nr:nucleoside deaminase [Anaerofustis stercorihominis]MCQ4795079.1 nucleoside deaminase [Anaerofustis stercorihominis]